MIAPPDGRVLHRVVEHVGQRLGHELAVAAHRQAAPPARRRSRCPCPRTAARRARPCRRRARPGRTRTGSGARAGRLQPRDRQHRVEGLQHAVGVVQRLAPAPGSDRPCRPRRRCRPPPAAPAGGSAASAGRGRWRRRRGAWPAIERSSRSSISLSAGGQLVELVARRRAPARGRARSPPAHRVDHVGQARPCCAMTLRLTSTPPARPSMITSAPAPQQRADDLDRHRPRPRRCRRRRTASRRRPAAPGRPRAGCSTSAALADLVGHRKAGPGRRAGELGSTGRSLDRAGDALPVLRHQQVEERPLAGRPLDQRLVHRVDAGPVVGAGQRAHLAHDLAVGPPRRLAGGGDIDVGEEGAAPPRRTAPGTAASAGTAWCGRCAAGARPACAAAAQASSR